MSTIDTYLMDENHVILKLYIPFCYRKCSYCHLPVCGYDDKVIRAHTAAMQDEIRCAGEDLSHLTVSAISIEGGSPALVPPALLQDLLRAVRTHFRLAEDIQIGIQTMPGDYSRSLVQRMNDCGVNFWTIALTTVNHLEHNVLERPYRFDALTMVDTALRTFPMRRLNFELLYGIPGQTMPSWKRTLDMALVYAPEHLTLLPLQLVKGTSLHQQCTDGTMMPCPAETMASFYEYAKELLTSLGYHAYTIYDFARPGCENKYRLAQLHGSQRLGFGYQADNFLDGVYYTNGHSLVEYLEHSTELPIIANHMLRPDPASLFRQYAISALTQSRGLDLAACQGQFGECSLPLIQKIIPRWIASGYAALDQDVCHLTSLGIASGVIHELTQLIKNE